MSRITIGNKASISMLQELARQAYGHGSTSAGRGRIGMVGNHVVKFNTHHGERMSKAGNLSDMQASCDALRRGLGQLAQDLYGDDLQTSPEMKKILAKLGLDETGTLQVPQKDLLTRSVVVKFLKQVQRDAENAGEIFRGVTGAAKKKVSTLEQVKHDVDALDVKTAVETMADELDKVYHLGLDAGNRMKRILTDLLDGRACFKDVDLPVAGDKVHDAKMRVGNWLMANADLRLRRAMMEFVRPFRIDLLQRPACSRVHLNARIPDAEDKAKAQRMLDDIDIAILRFAEDLSDVRERVANKTITTTEGAVDAVRVKLDKLKARLGRRVTDVTKLCGRYGYQIDSGEFLDLIVYGVRSSAVSCLKERAAVLLEAVNMAELRQMSVNPLGAKGETRVSVVREDLKDYATQVMNDKLGVGKADVSDLSFDSKKSGLLQYGATWTIKLGDKEFKRDPGEDPEKWKARLEDGIREFFGDDKLGILADRMFKDGLEVGMGGFLLNAGVPCRTPVRIFGMQTDENAVIVSFEKTDNGYRISESRTIENPSAVRFLPPGADELVQCSLKTDPDTMKKANPPEGSHVTTDYEVEIVRNGWSGDSKGRLPKIVVPKDPTVTLNLGEEPERHYQKSVD